jgi:hypothetical protein
MSHNDTSVDVLVKTAKEQGHSVFSLKISGIPYYYRSINRKEFQELQEILIKETEKIKAESDEARKNLKPEDPKIRELDSWIEKETIRMRDSGEERLVLKGLLHPPINPNTPAGVIATLADRIMQASGYGVEEEPEQL